MSNNFRVQHKVSWVLNDALTHTRMALAAFAE